MQAHHFVRKGDVVCDLIVTIYLITNWLVDSRSVLRLDQLLECGGARDTYWESVRVCISISPSSEMRQFDQI